jgi:hypothetical protein
MISLADLQIDQFPRVYRVAVATQGLLIATGFDPDNVYALSCPLKEAGDRRCLSVVVVKPGHAPMDEQDRTKEFTINCGLLEEFEAATWEAACHAYNSLEDVERQAFVLRTIDEPPSSLLISLLNRGFLPDT